MLSKLNHKNSAINFEITAICFITCIAVASVYITQPIFTDIAKSFSIVMNDARLTFTVSSIAYAISFFFLGPLSDYISARKLTSIGLLTTSLLLFTASFVKSFNIFLVILFFVGAFVSIIPASMFSLISRTSPKQLVGSYFGLIIASSVIGITLGRAGMGLLAGIVNWEVAIRLVGLLLLLSISLTLFFPKEQLEKKISNINLSQIYFHALKMISSKQLALLMLTGFLLFFSYLGTVTILTFYLKNPPFNDTSSKIGMISLVGISAVLGAPIAGKLTVRFQATYIAVIGLVLVLLSFLIFYLAKSNTIMSIALFLLFLGVFSTQPAIFVNISQRVRTDQKGIASSLYLLACLGAGSFSSYIMGYFWSSQGWHGVLTISVLGIVVAILLLIFDFNWNQESNLNKD